MTLQLDARQRAMLAEMGIRLFDPLPVAAAEPAPARQAPPQRHEASRARAAVATPDAVTVSPEPEPEPAPAPAPVPAPVHLVAPAGAIDQMDWDTLGEAIAACQACSLGQTRRNAVAGIGDRQAAWLVVGEAPGEQEDLQGEPFAGQAGKLLDNMLRAVGASREQGAFLTNALKCRPPGNRHPAPDELAQCEAILRRQVALLRPRVILAMGRLPIQALLASTEPLGRLRGRVHDYQGVPVVVTYPPAYLLRNPADKAKAWADLCLALQVVEAAVPSR